MRKGEIPQNPAYLWCRYRSPSNDYVTLHYRINSGNWIDISGGGGGFMPQLGYNVIFDFDWYGIKIGDFVEIAITKWDWPPKKPVQFGAGYTESTIDGNWNSYFGLEQPYSFVHDGKDVYININIGEGSVIETQPELPQPQPELPQPQPELPQPQPELPQQTEVLPPIEHPLDTFIYAVTENPKPKVFIKFRSPYYNYVKLLYRINGGQWEFGNTTTARSSGGIMEYAEVFDFANLNNSSNDLVEIGVFTYSIFRPELPIQFGAGYTQSTIEGNWDSYFGIEKPFSTNLQSGNIYININTENDSVISEQTQTKIEQTKSETMRIDDENNLQPQSDEVYTQDFPIMSMPINEFIVMPPLYQEPNEPNDEVSQPSYYGGKGGGNTYEQPDQPYDGKTGGFIDDVPVVNPQQAIKTLQNTGSCMVYQNQTEYDWLGDYQMCDGTWQYAGTIGAGATVCLISGTAFTLNGMDLVELYACDAVPQKVPIQPPYGDPQNPAGVIQVEPSCMYYQNQSDSVWKGDTQFCNGDWQYYYYNGEYFQNQIEAGEIVCLRVGGFKTYVGVDLVPLYGQSCDTNSTKRIYPKKPIQPDYGEPQNPAGIQELQPPVAKPIQPPYGYPQSPEVPIFEQPYYPPTIEPVYSQPISAVVSPEQPLPPPPPPPVTTIDSFVYGKSANVGNCMVYQNQTEYDWLGDYQMCDGTWQYAGTIGAGATVCLISGTAFTLNGMDLVELYPCDEVPQPQPTKPIQPPYGYPQSPEVPVFEQPYYPPTIEPVYSEPISAVIIPEQPTEMPISSMPTESIAPVPVAPPVAPPIALPIQDHPIFSQPINSVVTPDVVVTAPPIATPTPVPTQVPKAKTEAKKNLTPYVYGGLGILVILVVARMVTKKNS